MAMICLMFGAALLGQVPQPLPQPEVFLPAIARQARSATYAAAARQIPIASQVCQSNMIQPISLIPT